MDRQTWLNYYESAPAVVQDYLSDTKTALREATAQEKLAYDNDAWERVMDVVWDVAFAQLPKADFEDRLQRLAGDRKPEEVEKAVLFYVVLPLADLVPWDVEGRLQELGVSLSDIQSVFRVSLRPVSYGAAVRRIASQANVSLLTEEMVRRAREIFVSYLKGVRTVEQMKEMLQRGQGEGGLGFTREQAEQYVKIMLEFLATTQVMSEQEYADWFTKLQQQPEVKQPEAVSQPVGQEDAIAAAGTLKPPDHVLDALDEAIEMAVAQTGLVALDESMQKRLRNIVSTRLRDVRNAMETKSILGRDQKVGGLGLEPAEADRVAGVIEKVYAEHRTSITEEEKERIQSTLVEQQSKIGERKKRESEEHAKWFREKVQTTQIEDATRAKILAAFQESQARPAPQPGAAPPMPSLDDVRPPLRLTGLAEELGNMTLADFRRMSKNPQQAAEKVRQKLETLRRESFERWTEGVQAWRRSPLQQQYLKLVTESFSAGKPVAQLVEERRTADPSLPAREEIAAIVALNSQIQF